MNAADAEAWEAHCDVMDARPTAMQLAAASADRHAWDDWKEGRPLPMADGDVNALEAQIDGWMPSNDAPRQSVQLQAAINVVNKLPSEDMVTLAIETAKMARNMLLREEEEARHAMMCASAALMRLERFAPEVTR